MLLLYRPLDEHLRSGWLLMGSTSDIRVCLSLMYNLEMDTDWEIETGSCQWLWVGGQSDIMLSAFL